MFIAFRFVAGASAFMILAAVPILMNELVPGQFRGALVDLHGVCLVFGYVIQAWYVIHYPYQQFPLFFALVGQDPRTNDSLGSASAFSSGQKAATKPGVHH